MEIGFIGLGVMGKRICKNLIKKEQSVTILSTSGAVEEILLEGGGSVDTVKELAEQSDLIFTCLPNSEIVENIYLSEEGIINNAKKHSNMIDLSSITPNSINKIYKAAKEKNIGVLDAPVSGEAYGAENATLSIMVGGEEEIFEELKPFLKLIGRTITYIGPSGAGNTVKMVNNLLLGINIVAVAEAFTIGCKLGIEPRKLYEVISNSSGASFALTAKYENFISKGNFEPGFSIDLQYKDLELAVSTSKDLNAPLLIGNMVQQIFEIGRSQGLGKKDISSIIKVYENWNEVEVRE